MRQTDLAMMLSRELRQGLVERLSRRHAQMTVRETKSIRLIRNAADTVSNQNRTTSRLQTRQG